MHFIGGTFIRNFVSFVACLCQTSLNEKMWNCHGPVYGISDPYQTKSADPKPCVGELTFVATDNTATTILHQSNTFLQLFRSFSLSMKRCLRQFKLTSPGLLQQRGGPLCNCVHTAWTGNGPLWPPPGQALAQTMHKTRPECLFSHTGPPIFWHTGPQYSLCVMLLLLDSSTIN